MKRFLAIMALALALGGCVTAARVETRKAELVAKWMDEHPGQTLSPEEEAKLDTQAVSEVTAEAAKEREEALKKGGEAAGAFATGNIVGGIFALLGLGGLGVSAYRKAKGA